MDRMADCHSQYDCLCNALVLGGAPYPQRQKSTVDSAAGQLAAFRRKAASEPLDRELHHVLQRSKSIYQQAVNNYNDALHRPWAYIPAHLMGFRKAPDTLGGGRPDG